MSNDLQDKPRSEEIDIVEIFNMIGRGIKAVIDFVVKIFELLFKLLIILTIFIKKNLIILLVAAVIGFAVGFIYNSYQKPYYSSVMVVQPNFGTSTQLINNINLYSQLAKSGDSVALSRILGVSQSAASSITNVRIEPRNNTSTRLKLYDEFVKKSDTVTINNMSFGEFEKSLDITDFEEYNITIEAEDSSVFKKAEKKLIDVTPTAYTKKLKDAFWATLETRAISLKASLSKMDSLRKDYREIMLVQEERSKTPSGAGTTFYMGTESFRPTNEMQLFELEKQYILQLDEVTFEKAKNENYINIISGFQDIGTKNTSQSKFLFSLIMVGFALLFLVLKEFNKFLIMQEKNIYKND